MDLDDESRLLGGDFNEPQILDTDMDDHDMGYDRFLDTSTSEDHFQDHYYHSTTKLDGSHEVGINPAALVHMSTQSPESSTDSSSSGSSTTQHQRNGSLGSFIAEETPASQGIVIGNTNSENRDSEDRFMEKFFDINTAASSPTQSMGTAPTSTPSKTMKPVQMPLRLDSDKHVGLTYGVRSHDRRSNNNRQTSISPSMIDHHERYSQGLKTDLGGRHEVNRDTVMVDDGCQSINCSQDTIEDSNSRSAMAGIPVPQSHTIPPFVPFSPSPPPAPRFSTSMSVRPFKERSRVETQIPVHIDMRPLPPHVKKLHLQPHTITKMKQVAKPPVEKNPEMVELHAMLVSTTAMNDPSKRGRAFARAAGPQPFYLSKRRPSSDDPELLDSDELKPSNGGPVRLCKGCIERERKRASRKKTRNEEEEEMWEGDASHRAIIFNNSEIIDRLGTALPKNGGKSRSTKAPDDERQPSAEDVFHTELTMRITCYCRHQEEKLGFRVIFTLRDFQDIVIGQVMTGNIVTTDDHKTSATPSDLKDQSSILPNGGGIHSAGIFPQLHHAPAFFRQAYSTTDLQNMHQKLQAPQMNPFTVPQCASQNTSATLTPKTLSRPASPSTSSGTQNKRRKASLSGRIRSELAMTKLQTGVAPNKPIQSIPFTNQPKDPGAAWLPTIPAFAPNNTFVHGLPNPPHYGTNPPTPNTAEHNFFEIGPRSQSMENLQGLMGASSAPTSMPASRVPSPSSAAQRSAVDQHSPQTLANITASSPAEGQPTQPPVIFKLTPMEGSKSGGTEVTCLGANFHPNLVVMFGDTQATTTTFWGEKALLCVVPPAQHPGKVYVTFKQNYEQSFVSPPNKMAIFTYVDDEEQELMKHALSLINRQFQGSDTDAAATARNIICQFRANAPYTGGSGQSNYHHRQASGSQPINEGTMNLETAVLSCLELVDLDDSPYQASINAQNGNGQGMLHLSASLGFYRLTAGLLARSANPDIRDNNGMSPMHMASLRGHQQIIRKLRSAGGDPTLRTLNGFLPADMASSQSVRDASNALNYGRRSMSNGATPTTQLSRASSVMSSKSSQGLYREVESPGFEDGALGNEELGEGALIGLYKGLPVTSARMYTRSRRNSWVNEHGYQNAESQAELVPDAPLFAANPAMSAWRDQISAQIQQLQQSLHRTLPNLQIPAFPPIPNMQDYQDYPVVRRISSLVPQRNLKPSIANPSPGSIKEADSRWWDFITGPAAAPPAYEEIYPEREQSDMKCEKTSTLQASGEALLDRKCEAQFDRPEVSPVTGGVDLGSSRLTKRQREELRNTHALRTKKLRSDRKLFLFWIPLLVFVLVAMLKDRVPQVLHGAYVAFDYVSTRFQSRISQPV